jgi:hypothetical protein
LEILRSENTPIFIPAKIIKKKIRINTIEIIDQIAEEDKLFVCSYTKKNGTGAKRVKGLRTKDIISATSVVLVMILDF